MYHSSPYFGCQDRYFRLREISALTLSMANRHPSPGAGRPPVAARFLGLAAGESHPLRPLGERQAAGHHLRAPPCCSVRCLACPSICACAETLDIDLTTTLPRYSLFKVGLLPVAHDAVPLGVLLSLLRASIRPALGGRKAEVRLPDPPVGHRAALGRVSDVAHQHYFVQRGHFFYSVA